MAKLHKIRNIRSQFNKVILCSGHLIDAPERERPRFPQEKEELVRERIEQSLNKWNIEAGDLAICGGARGADIMFAEACVKRKAEVWLFISLEENEFLKQSVRLPNTNWEERFFALKNSPTVKTFYQHESPNARLTDISPFEQANEWMIDTAEAEAKNPDNLYAILIWDEQTSGDGPGGTAHFAAKVKRLGAHVTIINPLTF
jgi:predicted NodU family carbamoyl transferase